MPDGVAPPTAGDRTSTPRALGLASIVLFCVVTDVALVAGDRVPLAPSQTGPLFFLAALAILLSIPRIQLPRGYLTLGAIATNASGLVLTPHYAAIVGVVAGAAVTFLHRRVLSVRVVQVVTLATGPICAAATRYHVLGIAGVWIADLLALTVATAAAIVLTGLVGSVLGREPPAIIIRRNLSLHWVAAFLYFAIASLLIGHLLDGSATGYVLATFVAVLSLALSDSVAGRQLRLRLQAQVNDAERVVAYSRVVEGTIHNLRNHLAAASGHLEEVAVPAFESNDAKHIYVAAAAVTDAVELLDQLQAGNTKSRQAARVHLVRLAMDCCLLLKGRADKKRIEMLVDGGDGGVTTRSEPLLVKQIISNLVLNAIDAIGTGGRVVVEVGRASGAVYVTVVDNGPGVPEKYRARLFEPHFTTKPNGNGIGLFVSYRIAQQLGGDLRYAGSTGGAIFTLTLPAD